MKYILLFFTLSFTCCTTSNFFNSKNIIIDKFPKDTTLFGEKINIESIGTNYLIIIDTLLICFKAQGVDNYFDIYSTNTLNKLGACLTIGRGPNEFLSIQYNGQYFNDSLGIRMWLKDDANLRISLFNLTESIKQEKTIINSCIYLDRVQEGYGFLINDTLINIDPYPENVFFKTYELSTDKLLEPIKMFKNPYPNHSYQDQIFAMTTTLRPNNKRFASSMIFFNQINIYSSNFKYRKSLSIYTPTPSIKQVLNTPREERIVYYSLVGSTMKYIYALYINQPNSSWDTPRKIEIHIFDWDGIPIQKLIIPQNIIYFTIDEKHKQLLGITSDEEIYKYDISMCI